jgi:hypothetical protein
MRFVYAISLPSRPSREVELVRNRNLGGSLGSDVAVVCRNGPKLNKLHSGTAAPSAPGIEDLNTACCEMMIRSVGPP